ncbi:MAG: histidine kinase [Bacteroidota bacterium]
MVNFFRRITAMLPVFYLMNLLMIQGIYIFYENIPLVSCSTIRSNEWWITGFACLCSTIITFINEAMVGWEKWKASVTETSRLENAYHKTRLMVLKRQINPHFLFNCFNTLSSLINEDSNEADKFLDEMSKVYRYLLKGDNEHLVPLADELRFIQSYLYLNQTRFGSALQISVEVEDGDLEKKLPTLSLQVIMENMVYRNAFSKTSPLFAKIFSAGNNTLVIENNLQLKQATGTADYEEGLDNLLKKYQFLNQPGIGISETATRRRIVLPLICTEEVTV